MLKTKRHCRTVMWMKRDSGGSRGWARASRTVLPPRQAPTVTMSGLYSLLWNVVEWWWRSHGGSPTLEVIGGNRKHNWWLNLKPPRYNDNYVHNGITIRSGFQAMSWLPGGFPKVWCLSEFLTRTIPTSSKKLKLNITFTCEIRIKH